MAQGVKAGEPASKMKAGRGGMQAECRSDVAAAVRVLAIVMALRATLSHQSGPR